MMTGKLLISICISLQAAAALAVVDGQNDWLSTYTGTQDASLDFVEAHAAMGPNMLHLTATTHGAPGALPGSIYVFGIDRGAGTARLTLGMPAVGPDKLFDALAVMIPNGTLRVVTFLTMGPPTISVLPGAVSLDGNSISAVVPLSLLPSTGYAFADYRYMLWSRLRVNPQADGPNDEIADFAPDIGTFTADVPEPDAWVLLIAGFGTIGVSIRRRSGSRRSNNGQVCAA